MDTLTLFWKAPSTDATKPLPLPSAEAETLTGAGAGAAFSTDTLLEMLTLAPFWAADKNDRKQE